MPDVPRVPRSPTLVKALAIAGVAMALCGALPHPALATAPATDGTDLLASTLLDLAFVQRAPDSPPDLLAVEPDDETRGTVKLGLFRRVGDSWVVAATAGVPVNASSPDVPAPWLVDLGRGRFALLSASNAAAVTDVVSVTVGPSDLEVGQVGVVDLAVTDAGAADVDGDGVNELVVSSTSDRICAGTTFAVLGGPDLAGTRRWTVPRMRFGGAAVGRFTGGSSDELLAHAYETCPITPDSGEPHHLLGLRLADGGTLVDLKSTEDEQTGVSLGAPLVVDVDGDGRDEAVIRTGVDLAIVDPSRDWTATTLGVGDAMPFVALERPARILWVAPSDAMRPVGLATIERSASGSLQVAPDVGYSDIDAQREALGETLVRGDERASAEHPPPAAVLDIDGDGCPEILVPRLVAPCLGVRSLDPGPAWLATVPLTTLEGAAGRTVLVALGLDWKPAAGQPPDPSPLAAYAAGAAGATGQAAAWRHGPSSSFRLAELPTAAVLAGAPPASPNVEPVVAPDGSVTMSAPSGSRLLVRATPLNPDDDTPDIRISRDALLSGPADVTGTAFMTPPIGAAIAAPAAAAAATASFDVRSLPLLDGSRADRWLMDVAQLDPVGDLGGPVREIVTLDVTPPTLAVEVPLLSPIWPFAATIDGTSESGAEVRLAGGPPVRADAAGAFRLETQLAPWPQTLGVTATDGYGNTTTFRVSVMGGLDLRQLPWTAMLTVTFLLAALVASVRGARRARPAEVARAAFLDELPVPEIEDLATSTVSRRD